MLPCDTCRSFLLFTVISVHALTPPSPNQPLGVIVTFLWRHQSCFLQSVKFYVNIVSWETMTIWQYCMFHSKWRHHHVHHACWSSSVNTRTTNVCEHWVAHRAGRFPLFTMRIGCQWPIEGVAGAELHCGSNFLRLSHDSSIAAARFGFWTTILRQISDYVKTFWNSSTLGWRRTVNWLVVLLRSVAYFRSGKHLWLFSIDSLAVAKKLEINIFSTIQCFKTCSRYTMHRKHDLHAFWRK